MTNCLLGIGSNLGDRRSSLDEAVRLLGGQGGVSVLRSSRWVESRAIGGPEQQPAFLNGAVSVDTELEPHKLLTAILAVEHALGRQRDVRWGPRIVDLDLLLFGNQVIGDSRLSVPHPWMTIRHFVMSPVAEIDPERVHPEIGWTMERLLENLEKSTVHVAISGLRDAAQRQLLLAVANEFSAKIIGVRAFQDEDSDGRRIPEYLEPVESGVVGRSDECIDGSAKSPRRLTITVEDPANSNKNREQYNLRILLQHEEATLTAAEIQEQGIRLEDGHRRGRGPFLRLPTCDMHRLRHDLTAALSGMTAEF